MLCAREHKEARYIHKRDYEIFTFDYTSNITTKAERSVFRANDDLSSHPCIDANCITRRNYARNRFAIDDREFDRSGSVNSAANLRIDAAQVRISALRLARAVRRYVVRHPRRGRHPGRRALHHAGAHVGRGRADAAAQAAKIEIGGGQVGGEIAATVMGGVEQSVTR